MTSDRLEVQIPEKMGAEIKDAIMSGHYTTKADLVRNAIRKELSNIHTPKIFENTRANVEMIPMVIYIFILTLILFTIAFVVAPITTVVDQLAVIMDPAGSLYMDVPAKFDQALSAWYFLLVIMVVVKLAHLGLLAIKKQRTEGSFTNESDFR